MNAHSTLWHPYTDNHRGQLIADVISISDHITLNTTTPTRVPHYNKHLHPIIPRCLTHYTIGHRGQLNIYYHPTIYPSSLQSTYDMTNDYNKTDGLSPTTRKPTGHNSRKTHTFAQTTIHTTNIIFTNIPLITDKHKIPKGKIQSNCRLSPYHIASKTTQRNNIRRVNTCDPALKLLNEEITSDIEKHKENIWKEHLNAHWDHRHNTHILWNTIRGLSNQAPPPKLNTSITLNNKITTTPKHIANCFTKQ